MDDAGKAPLVTQWLDPLLAELPGLSFFDAHTHIGFNDPDGAQCTAEQLLALLAPLSARAVVFPMQEPSGYREANDRVLSDAAVSEGRLVPFCRLDPHELGRHSLELAAEFPDSRIILAHAAVSDVSWIWGHLPDHPNVFIDTAWWNPVDLVTLFAYAPPGRILFASDAPYGMPAMNAILTLRCALQAGLSPEQVRTVAGDQLERLLAGEAPFDAGPAPGPPETATDLILDRVFAYLLVALGRLIAGAPADEMVALARLGCTVDDNAPQAPTCRAMAALIDLYEQLASAQADLTIPSPQRLAALGPLLLAATLAATPRVPVPAELAAV